MQAYTNVPWNVWTSRGSLQGVPTGLVGFLGRGPGVQAGPWVPGNVSASRPPAGYTSQILFALHLFRSHSADFCAGAARLRPARPTRFARLVLAAGFDQLPPHAQLRHLFLPFLQVFLF